MNTAVFKIDGMICEGCASIAGKAIRDVPGVLTVEVDYQKGQTVVGTKICCPTPIDQIVAALKKARYSEIPQISESGLLTQPTVQGVALQAE